MNIEYPGECPKCPKYKTCTSLCDDAERYVNQDMVGQTSRILLSTKPDCGHMNSYIEMSSFRSPVTWSELMSSNVGMVDISFLKSIRVPPQYLSVAIGWLIDGKNCQEIGDSLGVTRERVRVIQGMIGHVLMEKLAYRYFWDKYLLHHNFPNNVQRDICQAFFKMSMNRKRVAKFVGISVTYAGRIIRKYKKMYRGFI